MTTALRSATPRGPVDPRLLRYATASRGFLVVSGVIVLAQTAVVIGYAWFLTQALVGAIQGVPIASLWRDLAVAAGLIVLRSALIVAAEANSAEGSARASQQLRTALVGAVTKLGPGWLSTRNTASLAVTAGHGLDALDAYFARYLPQLVATALATPILTAVIFLADWVSGVIVLVTLPLIPIFMILIGLATRAVQRRQYDTLQHLAARFADTVAGLSTLKIFGRQHRAATSIESVTTTYKKETMSVLRVSFLSGFALEFLASLSVALVAVTIGLRLLDGDLTLTIGLFVLLLAPETYLPIRQVGVQFHAAAEGVAATDEIFGVLDVAAALPTSRPEQGHPGSPARASDRPALRLRNVTLRRGDATLTIPPIDVDPGEIVLLRGPSGAGKSSTIAAILGFIPSEGSIVVGDEEQPAARRRLLAWSGQSPSLVAGTIAENVALGDAEPEADRVRAALTRAGAADLDPRARLGALGEGLSGGEAQRVAIARAFYRADAGRVLVLDEPSSALDRDTETALWRSLRDTADRGTAILLVSHRTSATGIADRVVDLRAQEVSAP